MGVEAGFEDEGHAGVVVGEEFGGAIVEVAYHISSFVPCMKCTLAPTSVSHWSTSGIGLETAKALSATGAALFLTRPRHEDSRDALAEIIEPGRITVVEMDKASFASIQAAAKVILKKTKDQVNILINNADVMGIEELKFTEDGHEITFASNYLGHFLLLQLLKPALLASSRCGGYNYGSAYAISNLANIYGQRNRSSLWP
ncbi:short-chain dehydrogenase/reductase [Sclerotinia borealis F-4128]|uniref:Short-chain dehydrogenase/reductase n=1 Tax=Sclerotinia borealis (strain F-4128) TaxID=1432307 RepID=W9CKC7_SCLBF|nr:short-chain dehydrogenase/reductase [Sclerotinia borealis F-4128]